MPAGRIFFNKLNVIFVQLEFVSVNKSKKLIVFFLTVIRIVVEVKVKVIKSYSTD